MTEHTVRSFAVELDLLADDIARMGGLAESALAASIECVTRRDSESAQEIIARDAKIDALQREVERRVVLLLALRQPFAQDLRQVVGALKVSLDLERIGDLAKNIAKRTLVLNTDEPAPLTGALESMGRLTVSLVHDVLDASAQLDPASAMRVWMRDDEVDQHYDSLTRALLAQMADKPDALTSCTHLLFVAKNLERVGDHATNIAEVVHFIATGEDIMAARPKTEAIPIPERNE